MESKAQNSDQLTGFCPECDGCEVLTRLESHTFKYGVGDDAPVLECVLPIRICSTCQREFVDEEGEMIRHAAVCRHLNLLTPLEVLQIRELMGTQHEFSTLSGIGVASLSRWETGGSLQTKAYDNFLYLLSFRDNLLRLTDREHGHSQDKHYLIKGRFRSIDRSPARLMQQRQFSLRLAA